jgi:hypothetical protein
LDHDPPIHAFGVTGMTDVLHHASFHWVRWVS